MCAQEVLEDTLPLLSGLADIRLGGERHRSSWEFYTGVHHPNDTSNQRYGGKIAQRIGKVNLKYACATT